MNQLEMWTCSKCQVQHVEQPEFCQNCQDIKDWEDWWKSVGPNITRSLDNTPE